MLIDFKESMKDPSATEKEGFEKATEDITALQADLERELVILNKNKTLIREDLEDSTIGVEESYVEDVYNTWLLANEEGQRVFRSKATPRKKFRPQVAKYLGSEQGVPSTAVQQTFCQILGWQPNQVVNCAHIVPFCFDSQELAYMFGSGDTALKSVRNSLFLNSIIEKGFDNGWVAIISDGSVERTPAEWKTVLLNDAIRKDVVFTNSDNFHVRWQDNHGRRIQFRNDNRPARRYLYFRYAMAHLKATKSGWPDLDKKVPSGTIWASPDKPSGYLRKSAVQLLAKRIGGDKPFPSDVLKSGAFEDTEPSSHRKFDDISATIEVSYRIKGYDTKKLRDDDEDDEGSEKGKEEPTAEVEQAGHKGSEGGAEED
ncbi:MAG: hypothetical protein Q9194_002687 [Teloschistes cf. exilis]